MAHSTHSFPKLRNFVLDVLEEGKRKNTVYSFFDADVTEILPMLKNLKKMGQSISFTSYILHCLATTLNSHKHMHGNAKEKSSYYF